MYYYSIATFLIQYFFDENSTWQFRLNHEASIMSIRNKFRIMVALYLTFLWCIVTIFILLLVKLM